MPMKYFRELLLIILQLTVHILDFVRASSMRSVQPKDPPRLLTVESVASRRAMVGDRLRLSCPVSSSPPAMVVWKKDGALVHPAAWARFQEDRNGTLRIDDLELDDAGSYECRATNGFGTVTFEFRVTVIAYPTGSPEFTDPLMANQTVSVGSSAVFRSHVRSRTHPYIQWLKRIEDGEETDGTEDHPTILFDDQLFQVLQKGPVHADDMASGAFQSKFTVASASLNSEGTYFCVATNTDGFSTSGAYLRVIATHPEGEMNDSHVTEYQLSIWILPLLTAFVLLCVIVGIMLVTATS